MCEDRFTYKMNRIKKKIALREIANYISCSITLLSKYERGERNMKYDKENDYRYYIDSK